VFCPKCKTEYRPGFTKCVDCGIDLVAHLPKEDSTNRGAPGTSDLPVDSDGRVLLWSGLSPALSAAICEALRSAGIPYRNQAREFGILPTLTQTAALVWVDPDNLVRARAIVEKTVADSEGLENQPSEELSRDNAGVNPFGLGRRVYNRVCHENSRPEDEDELPGSGAPSEQVADDIVEDFDPDQATAEVWSGDDPQTADYLKVSVEGVGVGCILREDGAQFRLFVLPGSERRAKEIVREIVEASPPE
jgi:hypothetical protein